MRPLNVDVFCLNIGKDYPICRVQADLDSPVSVRTVTYQKETNPFDSNSPNAAYYADFATTMLKVAEEKIFPLVKNAGSPEIAAQWIRMQCERGGRGGVLWYGK